MRCVGVIVRMGSRRRPTARVAVLEGDWSTAQLVDAFELTSQAGDLATQLLDLASGLGSRLSGLSPDRIVVRLADFSRQAANTEGRRIRLLAEGALAEAARRQVTDVHLMSGHDLAQATPAGSKASLQREVGHRFPGSEGESIEAALAAFSL